MPDAVLDKLGKPGLPSRVTEGAHVRHAAGDPQLQIALLDRPVVIEPAETTLDRRRPGELQQPVGLGREPSAEHSRRSGAPVIRASLPHPAEAKQRHDATVAVAMRK